jgi:hypothetical protein
MELPGTQETRSAGLRCHIAGSNSGHVIELSFQGGIPGLLNSTSSTLTINFRLNFNLDFNSVDISLCLSLLYLYLLLKLHWTATVTERLLLFLISSGEKSILLSWYWFSGVCEVTLANWFAVRIGSKQAACCSFHRPWETLASNFSRERRILSSTPPPHHQNKQIYNLNCNQLQASSDT